MIFAPVDRQFHQHFTTSKTPSRYLALIGGGNARYPLTQKKRDYSTAKDGGQGTIAKSTREGGSQVEYEDQDPRIHEIWLEEMRKNDIEPQFEKFGGPATEAGRRRSLERLTRRSCPSHRTSPGSLCT